MIEDYIKTTKSEFEDRTEKAKESNPDIDWQFVIKKTLNVIKSIKRDDRIIVHLPIMFDKTISDQLILGTPNVEKVLREINEFLSLKGLEVSWTTKDGLALGLTISTYVDVEELARPIFFKAWDSVISASGIIRNKIFGFVTPTASQSDITTDTSDSTMYQ